MLGGSLGAASIFSPDSWEFPAAVIFVPFQGLGRHKLVIARWTNIRAQGETPLVFALPNLRLMSRSKSCGEGVIEPKVFDLLVHLIQKHRPQSPTS